MLYTVKEVSSLSKVTIKTLHHYHKIGLLLPSKVSEAGYRLYGREELERLQQILFFRELDFALDQIKQMLEDEPSRLILLLRQQELLLLRKQKLETVVLTLGKSIACMKRGEIMDHKEMFKGLESVEEWREALSEQNQHLKQTYDMEGLEVAEGDIQNMNEQATEAAAFMNDMAVSLKEGIKHSDEKIRRLILNHLDFMNEHGHSISASDFAAQTRFFLNDDFHLQMLEGQQIGLAYFLSAAAETYATVE